jgi:hypothetical protein
MEPYKGVMLIPGDLVETMQDSFAALFVDNDFTTQKGLHKMAESDGGGSHYTNEKLSE